MTSKKYPKVTIRVNNKKGISSQLWIKDAGGVCFPTVDPEWSDSEIVSHVFGSEYPVERVEIIREDC